MSDTYVSHTKPWSRMQSLSESRGGSKVTEPIFSNSRKRYYLSWSAQKDVGHEKDLKDVPESTRNSGFS